MMIWGAPCRCESLMPFKYSFTKAEENMLLLGKGHDKLPNNPKNRQSEKSLWSCRGLALSGPWSEIDTEG